MSPFMPKITGQEDYVYVWTLGVEGMGDGSDKLVTVDVRPGSQTYGKVIASALGRRAPRSAPRRLHRRPPLLLGQRPGHQQDLHLRHRYRSGASKARADDRRFRREATGGVVGPHGAYALPGRMLMSGLSNAKDEGGRTALVEYTNDGRVPRDALDADIRGPPRGQVEAVADGYGYDARVLPRKNVMLTSSFTGKSNYMMDFGECSRTRRR